MPHTAAYRDILPTRRPARQQKSASAIETSRARCAARMAVVCDTALSPGARLLYVVLDDYAGLKGREWTHPDTLAGTMGISARQIFAQLAELQAAGHISRERGQYRSEYRLAWAAELKNSAVPVAAELKPELKPAIPQACAFPVSEPELEPACPLCHDSGRTAPAPGERFGPICDCAEGKAITRRLLAPRHRGCYAS